MQLTAHRAHRPAPAAPAPKAGAARTPATVRDVRLRLRHPDARERDPLLDWIQRGHGEASKARKGRVVALAISAALHVALVLAGGALLLAPKSAPVESPAGQVVYVSLPPKAAPPVAVALPAVSPAPHSPRPPAPVPRAAPAHTLLLAPAIPIESVAPTPVAAPTAVTASEAPQGMASQPDRAAPAPAPAPAPAFAEAATPAYLHAPEPEYPESAREEGQEGLVVLRVLVSSAGRPAQIRVSTTSGSRALDAAAVAGVKRWTFVAAKQGGRDIEAWMDVPIRFRLR